MDTKLPKHSPKQETKWKRGYKACLNCRSRKIKCDLGPYDDPHPPPCLRCKREQRECIFPARRQRGGSSNENVSPGSGRLLSASPYGTEQADRENQYATVSGISEAKYTQSSGARALGASGGRVQNWVKKEEGEGESRDGSSRGKIIRDSKWRLGLTSVQNTLEFLASAAGVVAREDEVTPAAASRHTVGGMKSEPMNGPLSMSDGANGTNGNTPQVTTQQSGTPQLDHRIKLQPRRQVSLSNIDYIGPDKILTENEATKLIELFFTNMVPFFPNIPYQLSDPKELTQYPILLCAILCVSSRYHPFTEFGGDERRHVEVHEKLWLHCQWMISQSIWGEASTRSIGTVLAFIIFTIWNPRDIHSKRTDYANDNDGSESTPKKEQEQKTGVSAIRRSDRMVWMLTGTAVRLAQDMGFIDMSPKIFITVHMADAFASINLNQRPVLLETLDETIFSTDQTSTSHTIANERFCLDKMLENEETRKRWQKQVGGMPDNNLKNGSPLSEYEREFLNDEYILYYLDNNDTGVPTQPGHRLPFSIKFTPAQCAKLQLLRILLTAYETIYFDKGRKRLATNSQAHNLAVLGVLSLLIEGWYSNYKNFIAQPAVVGDNVLPSVTSGKRSKQSIRQLNAAIDRESILCDYYFCQLYVYSLALQVDAKETKLQLNEIVQSAKYIELAYVAAKEIINSARRLNDMNMLKYTPVRWVIRLIRSVAFITKCHLALAGSNDTVSTQNRAMLQLCAISLDESLQYIKETALFIKACAPDELHLGSRYSAVLLFLYENLSMKESSEKKSEMKNQYSVPMEINVPEPERMIQPKQASIDSLLTTNINIGPQYPVLPTNRSQSQNQNLGQAQGQGQGQNQNVANDRYHLHGRSASTGRVQSSRNVSNPSKPTIDRTSTTTITTLNANNNPDVNYGIVTTQAPGQPSKIPSQLELQMQSQVPAQGQVSQQHRNQEQVNNQNTGVTNSFPDEVMYWLTGSSDIGLDFVNPWAEMIEQKYIESGDTNNLFK